MINAYAVDSFSILRFVSRDQWNNPTFETVSVKGYIQWNNKLIRNLAGEEIVSIAKILIPNFACQFALSLEDFVVIDGIKHSIARVDKRKDFSRTHWELYIL